MDCYCDPVPADVYVQKVKKARKKHVCCECGGAILPGEKYRKTDMLYDGSWLKAKECPDCMMIRAALDCSCYIFGNLEDDIFYSDEDDLMAQFKAVQKHRKGLLDEAKEK